MVSKPLYATGLPLWLIALTGALLIGNTLPSLASVLIAQTPLGAVPSAGKVLGWELNMNRQYAQQKNWAGTIQRPNAEEEPVIFYDDRGRTQQPQQPPYLLNTPQSPMK
jgi:hypothetical protein